MRRIYVLLPTEKSCHLVVDELEEAAHRQLGAEAIITRDPEVGGGVVGRAGHQRVDYTLPTLAERALATLGQETAALWS